MLILETAPWKFKMKMNRTALHYAVENGNIDIIKLLLEHKKIDVNAKDKVLIYEFL